MTDDKFVRLFQERAAKAGFYTGKIDGDAGPLTQIALDKALPKLTIITPPPKPVADLAYSNNVKMHGVHPILAGLIHEAELRSPTKFRVTEGVRTKERQAQLVRAGASKTQNSRHLTGHAVDLWPLDDNGKALPSDAAFPKGSKEAKAASAALWAGLRKIAAVVKEIAKERGIQIEWGGDWGWDAPHFQLNRIQYP